jgi:hypothetical protein
MATITPTLTVDPARMAANWGPGVQNNAMKWKQKTLTPKRLFNTNAAQSQQTLLTKVQAAVAANRYVTAVGKVDLAAMATAIDTYGETNYANSGLNKAGKYAAKTPRLAIAINAALAAVALIPRGTDANNDNRSLTFARTMRTYKGTI